MLLGGKRLRRFPDARLALLIGTPAKRAMETGAPSLKHPFARVFPHYAHFASGELKVGVVRGLPPATENLGEIGGFKPMLTLESLHRGFVNDQLSLYRS
jgi:hypothetical protein